MQKSGLLGAMTHFLSLASVTTMINQVVQRENAFTLSPEFK